jgi:hypothetical protein
MLARIAKYLEYCNTPMSEEMEIMKSLSRLYAPSIQANATRHGPASASPALHPVRLLAELTHHSHSTWNPQPQAPKSTRRQRTISTHLPTSRSTKSIFIGHFPPSRTTFAFLMSQEMPKTILFTASSLRESHYERSLVSILRYRIVPAILGRLANCWSKGYRSMRSQILCRLSRRRVTTCSTMKQKETKSHFGQIKVRTLQSGATLHIC